MLTLKPATLQDWARLYAWRHDAEAVRQFSLAPPSSVADHVAWLRAAIADDDLRLFVGWDNSEPVGTCRLQAIRLLNRKVLDVSVTVAPQKRGCGYAGAMVTALLEHAEKWRPDVDVVALVKADNYASLRAFADCGFFPKPNPSKDETIVLLERADL